jgi:RNA polymerase sigma-70 factor, ECF subfamily
LATASDAENGLREGTGFLLSRCEAASRQSGYAAAAVSARDVTALLGAIEQGDRASVDQLVPLVYDELRRLAAGHLRSERPFHTLQATALAHEAYVRLIDQTRVSWVGRSHFLAVASEVIRRILVDHARARGAAKRGSGLAPVVLDGGVLAADGPDLEFLDLDEALGELGRLSPRQARVVELKFFGGLENREVAESLGVSETLVKNEWRFARAWLAARLEQRP